MERKRSVCIHKSFVNSGIKTSEMFKRIFITIAVFLLTAQLLSAQKIFQQPKTISQVVGKINYDNKQWAYQNSPQYVKNVVFNYPSINYNFSIQPGSSGVHSTSNYKNFEIRGVNYQDRLTFFCRQEYKFEKSTKIPLRFRIGSLNYTNYLEQKPNALKSF